MTTTKDNERLIRDAFAALNERDLETFLGGISGSVEVTRPGYDDPLEGKEAYRTDLDDLLAAFPDVTVTVDRVFGEGEWWCTTATMTGTHEGTFTAPDGTEIPPTQREFELPQAEIFRIRDGQAEEIHNYYDQMTMMAQLGLVPD